MMRRTRRHAGRILIVGALMLLVAACSNGEAGDGPSDGGTDAAAPGGAAGAPEDLGELTPRLDLGVDPIEQFTASSGGGRWPELAWASVDGAARYSVTVYASDGRAYWAWSGSDESVLMGGFRTRPDESSNMAPMVRQGMTWDVAAFDSDGELIALSSERPISP